MATTRDPSDRTDANGELTSRYRDTATCRLCGSPVGVTSEGGRLCETCALLTRGNAAMDWHAHG